MLVYLLRHGRACGLGPGVSTDEQRFLTQDGIAALEASARKFVSELPCPQRVLHSPYRRARETAEIVARAFEFGGTLEPTTKLLSEADPVGILPDLQAAAAEPLESIALVGHEPHMGSLLGTLLTGTHSSIPMSVGMLAVVEVEGSASLWGRLVMART